MLNRQRAGAGAEEGGATINPADPPGIHCIDATRQKQSEGQEHKDGTVNEASILKSRIPANLKGKQIQDGSCIHGNQRCHSFAELRHPPVTVQGEKASTSLHQKVHQWRPSISEEGTVGGKAFQFTHQTGSAFFRQKLEGRCFNCFASNHIARFCRSLHRCWKCLSSGHRANECRAETAAPHNITRATEKHKTTTPKQTTSIPSSERDTWSYAEVVRGMATMAARYPGDP